MIRKVWGTIIIFFQIICFKGYSNFPENNSLSDNGIDILRDSMIQPDSTIRDAENVMIIRNSFGLIPFIHLDTISFASLIIGEGDDEIFKTYLGKYAPTTHFELNSTNYDHSRILWELTQFDLVNVGIYNISVNSDESFVSKDKVLRFLKKLSETTHIVVNVFGSQWKLEDFRDFNHLVWAFEDNTYTNMIVPQILFGARPSGGNIPESISDSLAEGHEVSTESIGRISFGSPEEVGMDSETLVYIDTLGQELVQEKAAPGCQIVVSRNGMVVYEKAFGYHTYDSLIKVDEHTLYDIASITKVAATVQAIMFLYGWDIIDLDKKASYYLNELKDTDKENIAVRDLLTHQAGLRPYFPFYRFTKTRNKLKSAYYSNDYEERYSQQIAPGIFAISSLQDSVWKWTIEYELREKDDPLKPYDYQYSDMGYYILKHLIEALVNQPLDEFLEQRFYQPLGLQTLSYNPLCKFPLDRITPTETDIHYRNTLLQGLVHDESAAMYGGVAGHAGLFSAALDLVILMQMNLQDGYYGGDQYIAPSVVKEFTRQQYNDNRRGLGWDKPETKPREYTPVSWFSSNDTYGHSGFTGTSVWVDPKYELVYVFLSNRIYPDRDNKKLLDLDFRKRIQNIIYDSILKYSGD
ncbi:serine hydrolase domain-containing protein [Bacteroidota bacterium]